MDAINCGCKDSNTLVFLRQACSPGYSAELTDLQIYEPCWVVFNRQVSIEQRAGRAVALGSGFFGRRN